LLARKLPNQMPHPPNSRRRILPHQAPLISRVSPLLLPRYQAEPPSTLYVEIAHRSLLRTSDTVNIWTEWPTKSLPHIYVWVRQWLEADTYITGDTHTHTLRTDSAHHALSKHVHGHIHTRSMQGLLGASVSELYLLIKLLINIEDSRSMCDHKKEIHMRTQELWVRPCNNIQACCMHTGWSITCYRSWRWHGQMIVL